MNNKNLSSKNPTEILDQLLCELLPGEYNIFGKWSEWKVSRHFSDDDYSDWEVIEEEFLQEYTKVVSAIKEEWGQPIFRGGWKSKSYPKWIRIYAIEMCYWSREYGIAYVAFHREDRELPYIITLGAISTEAIAEISEIS